MFINVARSSSPIRPIHLQRATRVIAECRRWFSLNTSAATQDRPLRVLFCGSDHFSIASLRALHEFSQSSDSNILSIDVALKTDKRTGKGFKTITPPPIKAVAQELKLPYHQFDTFTGWSLPEYSSQEVSSINLIVAVSFGLLVPPRILQQAQYGGLNVHPSLLPVLKGAAPLQWTLINGHSRTGVTVQTLHPSKFDEGTILAQTPPPYIGVSENTTFIELSDRLGSHGATMLVETIKQKLYLEPHQPVQVTTSDENQDVAPKIQAHHLLFDPVNDSCDLILRKSRALPKLRAEAVRVKGSQSDIARVVFDQQIRKCDSRDLPQSLPLGPEWHIPGQPFAVLKEAEDITSSAQPLLIPTRDGSCLVAPYMVVGGSKGGPAARVANAARLLRPKRSLGNGYALYSFHEPLNGPATKLLHQLHVTP